MSGSASRTGGAAWPMSGIRVTTERRTEASPGRRTGAAEPEPAPDGPAADSEPARQRRARRRSTRASRSMPSAVPASAASGSRSILLGVLLVITPLTVALGVAADGERGAADPDPGAAAVRRPDLIFLLRLVAADRRSRRAPRVATARKTVGMLEDEASATGADHKPPADETGPRTQG